MQHQLEEVQAERDGYRTMLHVALDHLHEDKATIERQWQSMEPDREAHRRLREQLLLLLEERVVA